MKFIKFEKFREFEHFLKNNISMFDFKALKLWRGHLTQSPLSR